MLPRSAPCAACRDRPRQAGTFVCLVGGILDKLEAGAYITVNVCERFKARKVGEMTFALVVLVGYLIGSIPSSYLSMRYFTGQDIRLFGTGNATITAVAVHGGRRPAAVAALAEIAKVLICLLIAHYWVGETWASLTILVAAVFGCNWSIWLKGAGGQGQTVGMVGLLVLSPISVLISGACYLLPLAATKRHFLSNQVFHLAIPLVLWLVEGTWQWALAGVLLVLPFMFKQWAVGDDVVRARRASGVGHDSAGV